MQQVTCKLLELDSRTHGDPAAVEGSSSSAMRARVAAAESEAGELRAAAAAHTSELKLALSEAAQLRLGLEEAEQRGAEEAPHHDLVAAAREAAEAKAAELSAACMRHERRIAELTEEVRVAEAAREVAENDVMELSMKCEDLAENCDDASARCEEALRQREDALEASRRHSGAAVEAAARADAAQKSEQRLRARLQAAREGLQTRQALASRPDPSGSSVRQATVATGGMVASEQGPGEGEELCVELSLVGERGLGGAPGGGLCGRSSRTSSRDGDTDASAWEEIMHAHDTQLAELREDLAAARAAGAMLTDSAEEAEELRRRVEQLEGEAGAASARSEVGCNHSTMHERTFVSMHGRIPGEHVVEGR